MEYAQKWRKYIMENFWKISKVVVPIKHKMYLFKIRDKTIQLLYKPF